MRTLTIATALMLAGGSLSADPLLPTNLDYRHQSYKEYSGQWAWLTCENIDSAAAQIAAIRHTTDKSLTQAHAEIMGTKTATAPVKRVMRQIASDAWASPKAGEGDVERAVADFRDEISAQCNSRYGY